jgi:hypothetical protein
MHYKSNRLVCTGKSSRFSFTINKTEINSYNIINIITSFGQRVNEDANDCKVRCLTIAAGR